jgi:hypothetical protein
MMMPLKATIVTKARMVSNNRDFESKVSEDDNFSSKKGDEVFGSNDGDNNIFVRKGEGDNINE